MMISQKYSFKKYIFKKYISMWPHRTTPHHASLFLSLWYHPALFPGSPALYENMCSAFRDHPNMKQSYICSLLYNGALMGVVPQDNYSVESAHEYSHVCIFDEWALSGETLQAHCEFMHTKCSDVKACDKTMESDLLALYMQIENTVDARLFDQQITEAGFAAGVCIHAVYDAAVFVPPNLYAPVFTPLCTSTSQPYYEDLFRETHIRPDSLSTEVYL